MGLFSWLCDLILVQINPFIINKHENLFTLQPLLPHWVNHASYRYVSCAWLESKRKNFVLRIVKPVVYAEVKCIRAKELSSLIMSINRSCVWSVRRVELSPLLWRTRNHIDWKDVTVLATSSYLIVEYKLSVILQWGIILGQNVKVLYCTQTYSELKAIRLR